MSHHPIATVAAVTGSAFARNENGELRVLKAGDTLLEGEVVLASADGHVELSFVDNSTMEVVEDQSVTLTSDLLESGPFDATDSALADDTAERILQLLAEDKEIDEAIEAPAAGLAGGEGGGGNNFVRLLRIAEGVDPLHYEFSGTSGTEAATFENPLEVDDDGGIGGATITVDTITADDIINSVEDDAPITVNGTVAGDAAAGDTVSFTVNGTEYTTTVDPGGTTWSVAVSGADLAADTEFEATVTGTDNNGNPFSGTTTSTHTVDLEANATITVGNITADDIVNSVEDDAPITVNGTVAGDAATGDTVSFTVNGTEYTTTVNPDGTTWSVAVSGSDLAADAEFEATVTGTDVNGNPFTGSTTSTHEVAPMFNITEDSVTLYEEGLQAGDGAPFDGIPETPGDPGIASDGGLFGISDPDGDSLTITLNGPDGLTSDGQNVTWNWHWDADSSSGTLIGSAGGQEVVDININDKGAYDVTLNGPIDHPNPGEDTLSFEVGVRASDGTAFTDGTLTINIADDSPIGEDTTHSLTVQQSDTNLMVILDVSGSMSSSSGVDGLSRLELAKQGIHNLLDGYDEYGDVSVRLVTFSSGAGEIGEEWMTVEEARGFINALGAGGMTNYDAALDTAMSAFSSDGAIAGAQNVSYFLSDGAPTYGAGDSSTLTGANNNASGDLGIQNAEETIWTDFLTLNKVHSIALGMGSGINEGKLEPIAYDGIVGQDTHGIVVTDLATLDATLQSTIIIPPITGSILASGVMGSGAAFGADGGYLQALTVDEVTYTFDESDGSLAVSQSSDYSYDTDSHQVTLTTTAGAELTVDFDDGTYKYLASPNVTEPYRETLAYTIADNDGDATAATLTLDVSQFEAQNDHVITNTAVGDSLDIPLDALTANDSVTAQTSMGNVVPGAGTDLSIANGKVTLNNVANGQGFAYEITTGGTSDSAAVDVSLVDSDTLIGTAGDDILINTRPDISAATNIVDAVVAAGDTYQNADQMGFTYSHGTEGVWIEAISLNLQAGGDDNAFFDSEGSGSSGPEIGSLTGIDPGDVSFSVTDGSPTLTVAFTDHTFTQGDSIHFGIDTDYLGNDIGAAFGDQDVQVTISFSDGTSITGSYLANADGSSSVQLHSGSYLDGGAGNDVLLGNSGNDLLIGGSGDDHLHGGTGNDILHGDSGDDILHGNSGNDSLSGGLGADTFAWHLGDQGTTISPAIDTMSDFSTSEGDKLDLSDLLQDENSGNLENYLHFEQEGSDTVVHISHDGFFAADDYHAADQLIVLEGVDLSSHGSDAAIIELLRTNGHLTSD
jgi:T1SS-143 domain-containing protein